MLMENDEHVCSRIDSYFNKGLVGFYSLQSPIYVDTLKFIFLRHLFVAKIYT